MISIVIIQAVSQEITLIGTYWPLMRQGANSSAAAGSLWRQLQDNYLTSRGLRHNPREYTESMIAQQKTRRLGRERNTCALIGEFNGRLTAAEPGAGPVILNNLCSKG